MARSLVVLCLIAVAMAGSALAAPSAEDDARGGAHPEISLPVEGVVITNPDWVKTPNGDDFADDYPSLPQFMHLGGRAVLHCSVGADGGMQGCAVISETPKGMGFGAAAVSMTADFKMKPRTIDGQSVSGGLINIPIRFLPAPAEPTAAKPDEFTDAPSASALALAHRLALTVH